MIMFLRADALQTWSFNLDFVSNVIYDFNLKSLSILCWHFDRKDEDRR